MPKSKLKSKTTSNRPAQRRLRVQRVVSMTIGDYRKMSPTALRNHTFRLWMKLGAPCDLPAGGARTREEMVAFAERLLGHANAALSGTKTNHEQS